jgi:hypothetical protein
VTANGYRDQLDRTRRFLGRVEATSAQSDVRYQDDVWCFFQNCLNLYDWIQNELRLSEATKAQIRADVDAVPCLRICYDIANGTKHYKLTSAKVGARHSHINTRITVREDTVVDCAIELEDGTRLSARKIARECMIEWERILKQNNLPTERLN